MMRWDVSSSFSLQTRRGFDLLPWESGNCMGLAGGSLVHLSFIIFGYLGTVGGAEIALDLEHLLTVPWHKTSNGSKSSHQRHHIRLLKISDHAVFISDISLCLFVSKVSKAEEKYFPLFNRDLPRPGSGKPSKVRKQIRLKIIPPANNPKITDHFIPARTNSKRRDDENIHLVPASVDCSLLSCS